MTTQSSPPPVPPSLPRPGSKARAQLEDDARLVGRISRMLRRAETAVSDGKPLNPRERVVLTDVARILATYGRDF